MTKSLIKTIILLSFLMLPALRLYNNAPGRSHGDIMDFLEAVRERIRLQLNSEP
jgi:hypothetical protein